MSVGKRKSGKPAFRQKQTDAVGLDPLDQVGEARQKGKPDRCLKQRSQRDGGRQAEYGWLQIQAEYNPGGVGVDGGTEKTRLHRLRRNGCAATCRCDCTKQNRTSTESFRQTSPLRLEVLIQKTSVQARSFLCPLARESLASPHSGRSRQMQSASTH